MHHLLREPSNGRQTDAVLGLRRRTSSSFAPPPSPGPTDPSPPDRPDALRPPTALSRRLLLPAYRTGVHEKGLLVRKKWTPPPSFSWKRPKTLTGALLVIPGLPSLSSPVDRGSLSWPTPIGYLTPFLPAAIIYLFWGSCGSLRMTIHVVISVGLLTFCCIFVKIKT